MAIITRDTPYNLYRTIEHLYYVDEYNMGVSFKLYNDIFSTFNKEYVDKKIYSLFRNYKYYIYDNEKHMIINKYRPENTYLKVYKSHIILKSDIIKPTLLLNYLMSEDLFVCDFKNKDYFWLNEFVR